MSSLPEIKAVDEQMRSIDLEKPFLKRSIKTIFNSFVDEQKLEDAERCGDLDLIKKIRHELRTGKPYKKKKCRKHRGRKKIKN